CARHLVPAPLSRRSLTLALNVIARWPSLGQISISAQQVSTGVVRSRFLHASPGISPRRVDERWLGPACVRVPGDVILVWCLRARRTALTGSPACALVHHSSSASA